MKKFVVLGIALALTGCNATIEEQNKDLEAVKNALPAGCVVHYAGEVRVADTRYPSRVFYVQCGSVTTTTETHSVPEGKTTREQSNVTMTDAAVVGAISQM